MSSVPPFPAFFEAMWGYDPFPWQSMLAERVAGGMWPQVLDLPTATGKTACIDIAIYALACQAEKPVGERTAPRRSWFVVDRRIVVDQAHERAEAIARKLSEATQGPLKEIADRLRLVGGTERPLAVARLRAGFLQDDGWARLPSQPAVITSTVDQVGSRLLFRSYGRSQLLAPIFAGLAAHDSLVLLDEAHCSVPLLQTLRMIETYRGPNWAESPLATPFAFAILSATPPADVSAEELFPGAERERALDHTKLRRRLEASKPAELLRLKEKRDRKDDPLVTDAVARALSFARSDRRRTAVIVNRVQTAESIARALRQEIGEEAHVVLLTGRMRSFERDRLVERWQPYLKADTPDEPERPIILVSTQCIEVGADFSFDALVTEIASLDALRQRVGRLNRMGLPGTFPAVVAGRDKQVESDEADPIYGHALRETWRLLEDEATVDGTGKQQRVLIDLGFNALDTLLEKVEDLSPYLAPTADAPILLPAHLDLLCQTAPRPRPEPDVQLFLHGKDRGAPDVGVVWRSDLLPTHVENWVETVALCPPSSGEVLTVPLSRLRVWLASRDAQDADGDVEGIPSTDGGGVGTIRPALLWRGRDRSRVVRGARDIVPNDLVVLPAEYGIGGLGQSCTAEAMGQEELDLWEPARSVTAKRPALRLHRAVLAAWTDCSPLSDLVRLAEQPERERGDVDDAIGAVLEYEPATEQDPPPPPRWLLDLLGRVRSGRMEDHPAGGMVLFARQAKTGPQEPDLFADDDDLTSAAGREISLSAHTASVEQAVGKLVDRCLPDEFGDLLRVAARWHDVGKLDERFQVLLRQGDELAPSGEPLAKSASIPASPARRRAIREASRLPSDFRHEMLSAQLAERYADLVDDDAAALVLHLIASHHGHARPFAPISFDADPVDLTGLVEGTPIELSGQERLNLPPAHSFDSGLPERFWRLTRRFGWWGVAYLEAILRLGDWYGSAHVVDDQSAQPT